MKLITTILKRFEYSKWFDMGCFEASGRYFLMQMQYNLHTNKKRFRRRKMGWVNDNTAKGEIYTNAKKTH